MWGHMLRPMYAWNNEADKNVIEFVNFTYDFFE
jgi:hypothetical protein